MPSCMFFGHRYCSDTIKPRLREVLLDLIENHAVDMFYVGQQGAFDALVRSVLRELTPLYPNVHYAVVLERLPSREKPLTDDGDSDTILPEGIEAVYPLFAVVWCNRWMLAQSEYLVTHITRDWGSAAQFVQMAKNHGKIIINIG